MRHVQVTCDKCKAEVVTFSTIEATAGPLRGTIAPADLCPDCCVKLVEFLRGEASAKKEKRS